MAGRKRVRHTIEVTFDNNLQKDAFFGAADYSKAILVFTLGGWWFKQNNRNVKEEETEQTYYFKTFSIDFNCTTFIIHNNQRVCAHALEAYPFFRTF